MQRFHSSAARASRRNCVRRHRHTPAARPSRAAGGVVPPGPTACNCRKPGYALSVRYRFRRGSKVHPGQTVDIDGVGRRRCTSARGRGQVGDVSARRVHAAQSYRMMWRPRTRKRVVVTTAVFSTQPGECPSWFCRTFTVEGGASGGDASRSRCIWSTEDHSRRRWLEPESSRSCDRDHRFAVVEGKFPPVHTHGPGLGVPRATGRLGSSCSQLRSDQPTDRSDRVGRDLLWTDSESKPKVRPRRDIGTIGPSEGPHHS